MPFEFIALSILLVLRIGKLPLFAVEIGSVCEIRKIDLSEISKKGKHFKGFKC